LFFSPLSRGVTWWIAAGQASPPSSELPRRRWRLCRIGRETGSAPKIGKAAANAALSWTGKHPAVYDPVPMRLARVEADEHGLTMWETAAMLTYCSTTGC
jgi:hypothetical protein